MTLPFQNICITGGRGRLARSIAEKFGGKGGSSIRLFSRQGGVGFSPMETLFEPSSLNQGGVLLHLAWSSLPSTAEQQPLLVEWEDLPLLRRLLGALQAAPAAMRPHLVFFSSGGAVYGNAPGRPSVETDACRPIGAYGRAKLAAEQMIETWARELGAAYTTCQDTRR